MPPPTAGSELGDHQIPLVIGVTGHRTLPDDASALRARVARACDDLRVEFPHTPVLVLSSLAEGADRLLAGVILARTDARLLAPLPLAPDDYRRDFSTDESRREFDELLARADRWFVVPGPEPGGQDHRDVRSRRYARAGAWIVEHCHVLVALWDGAEARGTGGTAHVVRWQLDGRVPPEFGSLSLERHALAAPEPGLAILVNPITGVVTRTPIPDAGAVAMLARLDAFTRDLAEQVRPLGPAVLRGPREAMLAGAPPDGDPTPKAIAARFAAADLLAIHFQRRDRTAILWIHGLFAAAMVLYGLIDWVPWFVGFHVVSFPLLALLVARVRRERIEDRALDYRALAEGMRVALFWAVAGVPERVSASYLSKHAGIVAWIRLAVRAVEIAAGSATPGRTPGGPGAVAFVRSTWVAAQRRYFADRRQRLAWWSRTTGWVAALAFGLAFLVAIAYLGFVIGETAAAAGPLKRLFGVAGLGHNAYQAALGLCGAVAVATEAYRKRRAFPELARQYAAAEQTFATAEVRFADGLPPDVILAAVGREALIEQGEWLWLHRSQPLDVPRA